MLYLCSVVIFDTKQALLQLPVPDHRSVLSVVRHVLRNMSNSGNKKPFKFGGKEFLFRGLLTCSVSGKVVTADTKTKTYANGKMASWTYLRYFCPLEPSKLRWVREEKILGQAVAVLNRLNLDAELVNNLQSHIQSSSKNDKDFIRNQFEDLEKQLKLVQSRSDTLMDLLLDGSISRSDFERKKELLSDAKNKIERELSNLKQPGRKLSDAISELLIFVRDINTTFESSNVAHKRQLLNAVFSNLYLKGTTLCFSLRKPFDLFIKCATLEDWRALLNDLRTNQETKGDIIQLLSLFILAKDD